MKKLYVRDEHGTEYEVEEIEKTEDEAPVEETEVKEEVKDESLTEEEIVALKKLASVADKLVEMCATKDECKDEDEDKECEDEEPDVDVEKDVDVSVEAEDEDEEEIEEVIDTDTKAHDSKKSFGAIERKSKTADSMNKELEIEDAWSKRYNK